MKNNALGHTTSRVDTLPRPLHNPLSLVPRKGSPPFCSRFYSALLHKLRDSNANRSRWRPLHAAPLSALVSASGNSPEHVNRRLGAIGAASRRHAPQRKVGGAAAEERARPHARYPGAVCRRDHHSSVELLCGFAGG